MGVGEGWEGKEVYFKELTCAIIGTGESEIHGADWQAEKWPAGTGTSVSRQNLLLFRETPFCSYDLLTHCTRFQVIESDFLTESQLIVDIIHIYKRHFLPHLY